MSMGDFLEMHRVNNKEFLHVHVLNLYLVAFSSLIKDSACSSVEATVVLSSMDTWLGNKAYLLSILESLEIVCQA